VVDYIKKLIKNMRKCAYRNCNKDISDMRNDAKYCCRNHKSYEKLYKKREESKKGSTKV
jgi:hypothetical protein